MTDNNLHEAIWYFVSCVCFLFLVGYTIEYFINKSVKKDERKKLIKGEKWNDR